MFDGDFIAGRIYYYASGQPQREEHYDAAGTTRWSRTFTESGDPLLYYEYDANGKLVREQPF